VKGYPTIKYFTDSTAATGDSYEGGRTYADLKKWADENLGPSCSPKNIDLCDDDQKAEIEKYEAMDVADLQAVSLLSPPHLTLVFLMGCRDSIAVVLSGDSLFSSFLWLAWFLLCVRAVILFHMTSIAYESTPLHN
jgi:hypothetical protein